MKQSTNPRRGRNRNNGKRNPSHNSRSRNYESSGSETRVRGSSQQILDKYLALARDASVAGDRIAAEGYQQYAEHYYRLLNPEQGAEGGQGGNQHERKPRYDNKQNRQVENPAKPVHRPQKSERVEVRVTPPEAVAEAAEAAAPEPVVETAEAPAVEPVVSNEEVVKEKPRRRGRPRKVAAVEPAA